MIAAEIKSQIPFKRLFQELFPDNWRNQGNSVCPFHHDNQASFQVSQDHAWCHAGCEPPGGKSKRWDIFSLWQVVKGCDFKTAVRQLGERAGIQASKDRKPKGEPVATYDYVDETGALLFQSCRYENPKTFSQRRPDGKDGWIYDLKGVRRVLYRLPEIIPADIVWIPEGEKDCDNLFTLGFPATSNPMGAGKWNVVCENGQPPEALRGKTCYIVPDNDAPGRKHAEDIARSLHGVASSVKVLDLKQVWPGIPDKSDVSDFIAAHHPDEAKRLLLELAASAPEYQPATETSKPENSTGEKRRFLPLPIVEQIRERIAIISFDGRIFRYQAGVYRSWQPEEIDQLTIALVGPDVRGYHLTEVRTLLQSVCYVPRDSVNQHGVLNLRNGLLDLRTGELEAHTPDFLSTVQLPIRFDPDAKCPLFLGFLAAKIPDSDLRALTQEFTGYLLTASSRLQRALLLVGRGRSGKSTLIKILVALLGKENVSSVPLDRLGDRFQTAAIDGKLANFSSELNVKAFLQDGVLKAIITADDVLGEEKHKPPYSFRPFCRIVAATNELPLSHDVNPAFFRRWIPIPMNQAHEDQDSDPDLAEKIIADELDGVLLWALAGLARLRKQARFTEAEASREIMEKWQRHLDPIREFAHRYLKPDPDEKVYLQTLFQHFGKWCKGTNRKSQFTDSNLKQRLEAIGYTFKKTNKGQTLTEHWLSYMPDDPESDGGVTQK